MCTVNEAVRNRLPSLLSLPSPVSLPLSVSPSSLLPSSLNSLRWSVLFAAQSKNRTMSDMEVSQTVPMEDRAAYFRQKFDILIEKYGMQDDSEAVSLRDTVVQWLDSTRASGDLVVSGFVDGVERTVSAMFDNASLQNEVKQLISTVAMLKSENEALEGRIGQLEAQNQDLSARLIGLETEKRSKYLNIIISDLGRMYAKYVIVPLLPKAFGATTTTWGNFCEQYRNMESDVDDGVVLPADFAAWIKPLTDRLTINLELLMGIIQLRNSDSHADIRSAKKQNDFIASLSSITAEGEHGNLIDDMVAALQQPTVKFTRML